MIVYSRFKIDYRKTIVSILRVVNIDDGLRRNASVRQFHDLNARPVHEIGIAEGTYWRNPYETPINSASRVHDETYYRLLLFVFVIGVYDTHTLGTNVIIRLVT